MIISPIFYFLLVLTFGLQLYSLKFLKKFLPFILFLFLGIFLIVEIHYIYGQYLLWESNALTKYLLPPYQSLNYLFFFTFKRFFGPYIISFFVGLLVFFTIKILNKRSNYRLFYKEEPLLAFISIFTVSHPGWILYLILIFTTHFLISLLYYFKKEPVSFRYLWVLGALFVILISKWLTTFSWWQLSKI